MKNLIGLNEEKAIELSGKLNDLLSDYQLFNIIKSFLCFINPISSVFNFTSF